MIRPLASFRAKEPSLGRVVTQFYFVTMGTVVPAGRASGCRDEAMNSWTGTGCLAAPDCKKSATTCMAGGLMKAPRGAFGSDNAGAAQRATNA